MTISCFPRTGSCEGCDRRSAAVYSRIRAGSPANGAKTSYSSWIDGKSCLGAISGHQLVYAASRRILSRWVSPKIRRPELTRNRSDATLPIPASVILQDLHDQAPVGQFTLDWLMGSLHKQSFGLIMLVLAIVAAAPGISLVGGLLLFIPSFQMIAGRDAPIFPRWIANRPLPTRHLGAVAQRAISILRYIEKAVHPRCPTPPGLTKRVVGIFVVMLTARLLLSPIP